MDEIGLRTAITDCQVSSEAQASSSGRGELIERIIGFAENLTPIALIGPSGICKTSAALTILHHHHVSSDLVRILGSSGATNSQPHLPISSAGPPRSPVQTSKTPRILLPYTRSHLQGRYSSFSTTQNPFSIHGERTPRRSMPWWRS